MVFTERNEHLSFDIDSSDLKPSHVRAIKSLNTVIHHLLTTESEDEYFESSAEALRICAALIKQAKFPEDSTNGIPYAQQVLEFSMETLTEHVEKSSVIKYDN